MRKMLRMLLLMGCLFCGLAQAQIVSHLNVANLPVANASESERQRVLPKAFGRVLVKISGNPSVMTLPVIQNALSNINDVIQSYRYLSQSDASGHAQLTLQVTFDKKGLNAVLRKAGQAVWSNNRPLTLIWLQIRNGPSATVLSSTNGSLLSEALQRDAERRGVPILLPAMDLQDQSFVNTSEESPFDLAKLKQATQRYAASSILAGDVSAMANGRWRGRWLLLVDGAPYRWENTGAEVNDVVARAINDMSNLMANQLAVTDDKDLQSNVTLAVEDVSNLGDYIKVLKTLRHLLPVSQVIVKDMTGSGLLVQIKAVGGEQALARALSSQDHFAAMPVLSGQTTDAADLYYRWLGDRTNTQSTNNDIKNNVDASASS